MARVFISYCHQQGNWVWARLVPCLKAGGAEVLIDRERFEAGKGVIGQMDATQDQAERHVLVLSPAYLNSAYCRHELERAIGHDPSFQQGIVVPVLLEPCSLPESISRPNPLYPDLCDDRQADPWTLLLQQCGTRLGTTAPAWLEARDAVAQFLGQRQSVNLVADEGVAWRGLIENLARDHVPALARVDLTKGVTASRRGLVAEILSALGARIQVPAEPDDLGELDRVLSAGDMAYLALTHFDLAAHRQDRYGLDLFTALRYLVMDARKLVLLVHSRQSFAALLPANNPVSSMDIKTVQLSARP